jgi:predicted dehydrogenase/threonine dehydrogenase-like Zn-dependent dehydrogenase
MRQVLQSLRSGRTTLAEVPAPGIRPGHVLIRTTASVVSVGTERMLVEFGRAGYIDKARRQPEKVRQVLDKVRVDGLMPTVDAVRSKLDASIPMGYCNAGVVVEVGPGVPDLAVGDRVASNGPHAEVVLVPHRLCARIPDGVSDEHAAWTVLGAIGLQGIRLLEPTLGETIAVTGLGPIGLLCVQMLRASGCRVLAIDVRRDRCEVARGYGAATACLDSGDDPVAVAEALTSGRGIDGVLLTASTKSDEPVHQAATMCRKNGRIVLVGVTGLALQRSDFYEKELTFRVSCSYGPGRYDDDYERGRDYPVGFVRWTEQRNFEAVLGLLESGSVRVAELVTKRIPIERAEDLYARIDEPSMLGAVFTYPQADQSDASLLRRTIVTGPTRRTRRGVLGVLGAGNFAARVLVPLLAETPVVLDTIATNGGVSGTEVARRFGFRQSTTDIDALFDDPRIDSILVATRHDSHAAYAVRALETGRAVYVEKPLALTHDELDRIEAAWSAAESPLLMVGFNRRFAPQAVKIRELLSTVREPKTFVMTVNAGVIPPEAWVQSPAQGGRILGEACHWIDLLRYLAGSPIVSWQVSTIGLTGGLRVADDKTSFTLSFADGSIGTVHYVGSGSKAFPKERLEVFTAGRTLQLGDFKTLRGWGWPGFRKFDLRRRDKGHSAALAAFVSAVRRGCEAPVDFGEVLEISRAAVAIAEAARSGGGHGSFAGRA